MAAAAATLAATVLLADQGRTQPTCEITYTGASGGSWITPGNWNLGRVPAPGDDVCLDTTVVYPSTTTSVSSVQGTGTLQVTGGTLNITDATDATLTTLQLQGGAIGGAGTLTLTGSNSTWTSGTMSDAGTTTVAAGATLVQQTGNVTMTAGRLLEISGKLELRSDTSIFSGGAAQTIHVMPGGEMVRAATAPAAGGTSIFNQVRNDGLVQSLSGTLDLAGSLTNYNGATATLTGGTFAARDAVLDLSRAVDVNAANLVLEGATAQINGMTGLGSNAAAGMLELESNAALPLTGAVSNAGTVRLSDTAQLTSDGNYTQTGGLTQVVSAGSQLTATGGTVDIQGGRLEGAGTVGPSLRNAAEVRPGTSPGILTVSGTYTQTAGATLRTEIGGATPGTQYDRLVVTGSATLAGTLAGETIGGFTPAAGASFEVVTCSPCTGAFGAVTSSGLPAGLAYAASQTAAATSLVVATGPPPDTTPPDTTVTSGPSGPTDDDTPTFAFNANEAGSTFECSVDGAPFAPCSSPFTTPSLSAGQHTFSVRARDAAGNVGPASTSQFQVAPKQIEDLPPLTNNDVGEVAQVAPASGTVLIAVQTAAAAKAGASQKGLKFVPLEEAREIPIGSFLDTTRGTVEMVSATGQGNRTQSGKFSAGLFQVLQSRRRRDRGLTELSLKGGNFRRCGSSARGGRTASAALSRRTIRRVRSNATGRFRTRGRNSSATVRGTIWTTTDRCDGTLTQVRRGTVIVRDFRRKRNVAVRAGKSYLARARG